MKAWPENSGVLEHINTSAFPENFRAVEHISVGTCWENSTAFERINMGICLELSKALAPMRSADTERFATSSQGIRGYISVMTVFEFTYFFN